MWRVAITVFRPYRPRLGDTLGRAFEGGAVFEIVLMQMTKKTMTKDNRYKFDDHDHGLADQDGQKMLLEIVGSGLPVK